MATIDSKQPQPQIQIKIEDVNDDEQDPELPIPPLSESTSNKDRFKSLKNKANKIANAGTRKLRGLTKPNIITKSRSFDEQKQAQTDNTSNENNIKIKRKLSVKLNKVFNNIKSQKSESQPSTPTMQNQNEQKQQTHLQQQQQRPSIIIGATYSHSDNEMIEKMHQKKSKKRSKKLFLHKPKPKANNHENKQNDTNDDVDNDNDNSVTTFLKNIDINSIISQSSQSINNLFIKSRHKMDTIKQKRDDNKMSKSYLKAIPQKALQYWKRNMEYETNRFAKMSSQATYKPFCNMEKADYFDNSDSIDWDNRIMTDIIRAGKLFVCGEINEIFEFPSFKNTQEKEELVRTTIRYLESAVQSQINCLLTANNTKTQKIDKKMHKDAAKEISVKAVRQALISLCQEFVNDPYFKYLKQSCEKYGYQPTDIGLTNQDIDSIKSWTPRLCINITGKRIYTHIVRVFQCYQLNGIEAIETQIYFGFKRTYSIDCLGGPPMILPPIFLSHDKLREVAYQISIPKEKILDQIYADIPIPKATDFIPTKSD